MGSGRRPGEPLGMPCEDPACFLGGKHWHRPSGQPAGKGPRAKGQKRAKVA